MTIVRRLNSRSVDVVDPAISCRSAHQSPIAHSVWIPWDLPPGEGVAHVNARRQ